MKHLPNAKNTNEPKIIWNSRDLPIPIDYYPYKKGLYRVSNPDNLMPIEKFGFWVTIKPDISMEDLQILIEDQYVEAIRLSTSSFANKNTLTKILDFVTEYKKIKNNLKICLDIGGPKVRVISLKDLSNDDKLNILEGEMVAMPYIGNLKEILNTGEFKDIKIIPIDSEIPPVKVDDLVLMSDGWTQFKVLRIQNDVPILKALSDGRIFENRGIDIKGLYDNTDWEDSSYLRMIDNYKDYFILIDYLALSFVNSETDIKIFRDHLSKMGLPSKSIIAKIETIRGYQNIEAIIKESNGIMIARGDFAVQIALNEMDIIMVEDRIRDLCIKSQKECIIATRIADSLESGSLTLKDYEIYRIGHELSQPGRAILMLANETADSKSAVKNLNILKTTIEDLFSKQI